MGLLQQKIKEIRKPQRGRPNKLELINLELAKEDQQDLIEIILSDIEATIVAKAIQQSELSETAMQCSTLAIARSIRNFRNSGRQTLDVTNEVAS